MIDQRSVEDFPENDFRRMIPKYSGENFPRINALNDELKKIGEAHDGATSAQVTIAWLLAQAPDIIPLPGSKQIKYIEENLGALNFNLSGDEVKKIRALVDDIEKNLGSHARMPEWGLALSWVETPLPASK